MNIFLNPRRLLFWLWLILFILLLLGCLLNILFYIGDWEFLEPARSLFDFDGETNFPTFYSVCLMLLVVLAISSLSAKTANRKVSRFWKISSVIIFFVALDEFTQLHERLIDPMNDLLQTPYLFSWIWIYIPILIVVAALIFPLFKKLSPPWRKLIYFSVAWYLFGAVFMETINGLFIKNFGNIFVYKQLTIVEEFFEIFAFLFLLSGLFALSKKSTLKKTLSQK